MTIYSQTTGSGPDLVLIHGWGLHGGIWDEFVPLLETDFRVTCVDLPGHGRSEWQGETTLDAMVDALLDAVPHPAAWLGWSLGGLLASRAALRRPARVNALVMLASTPCFVRKPGWQPAMLPALLETFAADLQADYSRTLNRFLSLQVRGSVDANQALKTLRGKLLAHGEPSTAALQAGLDILRTADLREQVCRIHCPVMLLMGERDMLVPVGAGRESLHLFSAARLEVIKGAGHAPFIAQPEIVAGLVQHFLQAGVQQPL
jgi:pimeloyl-[acyl-carrier protein] methyl ester esterase